VTVDLKKEKDAIRRMINRILKNVEIYRSESGDSYIRIITDKGSVLIGANDLGVWIASEENLKDQSVPQGKCTAR
jgi:hypothetical protein